MNSPSRCKQIAFGAVVIGILAAAPESKAGLLLSPGGEVTATATMAPSGTILASETHTFSSMPGVPVPLFSGSVTVKAIADTTNPLGGITFTYQVTIDASSESTVDRVTVRNFFNTPYSYATQVGYSGTGQVPLTVERSLGNGNEIGFQFDKIAPDPNDPNGTLGIDPGETSVLLVVRTNAETFAKPLGSVNIIDGEIAFTASISPAGLAVPEPGTLAVALLAAPLLGLGYYRHRRQPYP